MSSTGRGASAVAGKRTIRDSETSSEFITLARVVKTQGRRGEVASEILSDIPDRFAVGVKLLSVPWNSPDRRELELSFFFSSRRRHTRCSRDWSSDVCSSDLKWKGDGRQRRGPWRPVTRLSI